MSILPSKLCPDNVKPGVKISFYRIRSKKWEDAVFGSRVARDIGPKLMVMGNRIRCTIEGLVAFFRIADPIEIWTFEHRVEAEGAPYSEAD